MMISPATPLIAAQVAMKNTAPWVKIVGTALNAMPCITGCWLSQT